MNRTYAQQIYEMVMVACPICKELFRCRVNLRNHLKRNHNDIEAEVVFNSVKKRGSV